MKSVERIEQEKMQEAMLKETLDVATPVPQNFEQATSWAVTAAISAAEAGNVRQSMFFSAGGGDEEVSGDLGGVLTFAESFAKTLVTAEALDCGSVTVMFTDMGAAAMSTSRWEPLPEGLKVDYFPPVLRGNESIVNPEERKKIMDILKSDYIMVVAPTQTELPALLQLLRIMEETGKDVPVILFNPKLVVNAYIAAGSLLRSARELEKTLVPTFHLEQFDTPDDESLLNPAVVTRVWPRPFSLWEDNPDDSESIDGFFLLDVNDDAPYDTEEVNQYLQASLDIAKKWMEREAQRKLE